MKDVVSKWEMTGLLENLGDSDKEVLADMLDRGSRMLMKVGGVGNIERTAGVSLPGIRRVFDRNGRKPFDVAFFLLFIDKAIDRWYTTHNLDNFYLTIDAEDEMTANVCDQFVKEVINGG